MNTTALRPDAEPVEVEVRPVRELHDMIIKPEPEESVRVIRN